MADRGVSSKQVRLAREKLGIVIRRAGNRAAAHSVWALPAQTSELTEHELVGTEQFVDKATAGTSKCDAALVHATAALPRIPPITTSAKGHQQAEVKGVNKCKGLEPVCDQVRAREALAENEQRRHRARVEVFVGRGIPLDVAVETADALVIADRNARPAVGSCAQCQNMLRGTCPVTPRAPVEVHECWYRRQDTL
jgi:hypothetical protein